MKKPRPAGRTGLLPAPLGGTVIGRDAHHTGGLTLPIVTGLGILSQWAKRAPDGRMGQRPSFGVLFKKGGRPGSGPFPLSRAHFSEAI